MVLIAVSVIWAVPRLLFNAPIVASALLCMTFKASDEPVLQPTNSSASNETVAIVFRERRFDNRCEFCIDIDMSMSPRNPDWFNEFRRSCQQIDGNATVNGQC
jgi:hypothetical protein